MRSRTIACLALAGTAALAACGASNGTNSSATKVATQSASSTAAIRVSHSSLGDVLVDAHGMTLYGFTNDTNGVSTCRGTCAMSWMPLIVSRGWKADPAVVAKLHVITRADGQHQLVAGKWPLYTFTGDRAAGDVNGQGSLGKWFVVQPDGKLHTDTSVAPASPTTSASSMSGYGY